MNLNSEHRSVRNDPIKLDPVRCPSCGSASVVVAFETVLSATLYRTDAGTVAFRSEELMELVRFRGDMYIYCEHCGTEHLFDSCTLQEV